MSTRFVVGIDLGTTNSVVAYAEASVPAPDADAQAATVLPVPQLEFNVRQAGS